MAKGKGSNFEREISKELSLWITSGERDDVFWRTSQSGGRATVRSRVGKTTTGQAGDICAIDPVGFNFCKLFAIECKRGYSDSTIDSLLDRNEKSALQVWEKWIAQAEQSRQQNKSKFWIIIARQNNRLPIVMMPWKIQASHDYLGMSIPRMSLSFDFRVKEKGKTKTKREHVIVMLFSDWKKFISPDEIDGILQS